MEFFTSNLTAASIAVSQSNYKILKIQDDSPLKLTMKCNFQLSVVIVFFIILRLSPTLYDDPQQSTTTGECPTSVRFASVKLNLCGCEIAATSRFSHLRPSRSLLSTWLLLLSGDIEVNPGPKNWRFPCGVCSQPVRANQRGVQCDVCATWLHTRCIGISNDQYVQLQHSDDPWSCQRCLREALPLADISSSDSIFNTSTSSTNSSDTSYQSLSPSQQVLVFYSNCRSLSPKLDHLRLLAEASRPLIICLCETWLDESISNDEIFIPGFSLIRRDRDRHGGGIAMYIHDSVPFTVRLKHPSIELLLVNLKIKRKSIVCGLYYRPPSSNPSDLVNLESTLQEIPPAQSKSLLLLGDFNIDLLKSSSPALNSIVDKQGLTQVVTSPTRSTSTSATLIDHVYLSEELSHSSCNIAPPLHDSDHSSICLHLDTPPPRLRKAVRKVWLYKQADFETANTTLQCLSSDSFPANDINSLWTQWYDFFMTTISQTIPSKVIKRRHNLPFLTSQLTKAIRKKFRLFRLAKKLGSDRAWHKYNQARNRVTTALRSAKAAYFENLSSNLSSPKDFWSAYHKLAPKKDRIPVDLKLNSVSASSSIQKANLLNKFFSTCFSPPSDLDFPDTNAVSGPA